MVERIKVSYRNGAYYVDRPNWGGGDVVPASDYAELEAEVERLTRERDHHSDLREQYLTEAERALAERAGGATHRHKKRGTEYVLIGIGKMQAEHWRDPNLDAEYDCQAVDMREVAIYRSVDDGSLWVRPREEFEDGRFEALTTEPAAPEGRQEAVPQFRKAMCADWYDGFPDHSDGGGPYETRVLYIRPAEQAVTEEMVEAVQRIRKTAMRQSIVARIPECGEFGGIAQDADWLLDALKDAMEEGR